MLRIRIVIAGAVLVMAVGGAAAQSTADPGKPIQLLHVVEQPNKAKTHAKAAKKSTAKKYHALAAGQSKHRPASSAKAAAPAKVWPELEPAPAAAVAAAEPAPQADHPDPSALVVGGQTVQVAAPGDVNPLDLAADKHADAAATASKSGAAAPVSKSDASDPATTSDAATAQPVAQAMMAAPEQQDASPIGSTSWIAKVLAALGGAIAAGSVAWFLIGSTPQRTYG